MKKTIFFLVGIMMVSSIGFSAEKKSLESSLSSIENQFNELIKKEEAQKERYRQQKAQLEAEVEDLKSKQTSREKLLEKLKVDSEVRWHRDKYKKILNNAETLYKNIDKSIAEKEKKIAELDTLLSIMN
ncbi:adhesion protein FadA [Leptotrichia hongkongensis]|uniref:Adhesion protein FadA n=1 Tax=Leptotrichia hongkongensis TaxID=554406 RepID=A0ABV4SAA5_9FUSO